MPLLAGQKNVGHNIEVEQRAGKPHRQAVAIALSVERRGKKRKRPAQYARIPAGVHGTPSFNPGNPDPETVERRKTDPLWMYHRGLVRNPNLSMMSYGLQPYHQFLQPDPSHIIHSAVKAPEGIHPLFADAYTPYHENIDPFQYGGASQVRSRINHDTPTADLKLGAYYGNSEDTQHSIAHPIARFGTRQNPFTPSLINLVRHAKAGDPYRVYAASILGGNRHAIPLLVQKLRERDNPAGFWKGWTDLHRRMEREQGNLAPHQVAERIGKIVEAIKSDPEHARHLTGDFLDMAELGRHAVSPNPKIQPGQVWRDTRYGVNNRVKIVSYPHNGNSNVVRLESPDSGIQYDWPIHYFTESPQSLVREPSPEDFSPYYHMTDAMDEAGMEPHWANLVRSELSNVMPDIQRKGKGNRRFARKSQQSLDTLQRRYAMGDPKPSLWFFHDDPSGEKLRGLVEQNKHVIGGHDVGRVTTHTGKIVPAVRLHTPTWLKGGGASYSYGTNLGFDPFRVSGEIPQTPQGASSQEPSDSAGSSSHIKPRRTTASRPISAPIPEKPFSAPISSPGAPAPRVDVRSIENRLTPTIHDDLQPEHLPLWDTLARGYAENGNRAESDIARDHADFYGGRPVAETPGDERHMGVKRSWLNAEARFRDSGDVLQLAKDHDRILTRLKGGLQGAQDVPALVRTAGSESGTNTLQRLENLGGLVHGWLGQQDKSQGGISLHRPLTTTHHLADLAMAYAKAKLGRHGEAEQQSADVAAKAGALNDPVLASAVQAFQKRVAEAKLGRPHTESPPLLGSDISQYAFNRLGQASDILDPSNRDQDIYKGWKTTANQPSKTASAPDTTVADALSRGATPVSLLSTAKSSGDRLQTATALADAARGMIIGSDKTPRDPQRGIDALTAIEPLLLTNDRMVSPVAFAKMAQSYIRGVAATRDEQFIDQKLTHLFRNMQPFPNSSSESRHFSAQHYRILEEAIRAVVGEGYDMGEVGRDWSSREEQNIRRRIRGFTNNAVKESGVSPAQYARARKRKKRGRLRMKNTVLQPWQTSGGSCSYARDDADSELRMIDSQILSYVRSGRAIPRNLLQLAVSLRQTLQEEGMDTVLLPIPYKRRYALHDDPTGMMVTRRAGKGEMDAPVYAPQRTPVVTSYLKDYLDQARIGTRGAPGKRMSVFVVHRNHKPVAFSVDPNHHEPYSVNGLDHVLHSTWENGRPIAGNPFSGHPRAETGERFSRKYAADADIPFAEVVGPHEGAGFEPGLGRALPVFPNPYKGTPDQREHRDAPWNRWSLDAGAATREAHAARIAMRQLGGVPLDHPTFGGESYHRHMEAMANAIRTNPNSLPVHDYLREAMHAGEKRYDQGRMVNAAKRLLLVVKSDPKNRHLNLYQRVADAEAKEREPQAGLGTVAESGTPTYHDIDLPPEPAVAAPPIDEWGGGRRRGPREAPVVAPKVGRGKKDLAVRTGFMEFMHQKGVPDAEAIDELGLQHMISPQQAKRMWTTFKKSKQQQKMSRVLQIVRRMRGAA